MGETLNNLLVNFWYMVAFLKYEQKFAALIPSCFQCLCQQEIENIKFILMLRLLEMWL